MIKEAARDHGFWVHLISQNDRKFAWKRYEEVPDGGWGPTVLDEGDSLYETNNYSPPRLPWVVWLRRGAPGEFIMALTGDNNGSPAQVVSQQARAFTWNQVEPVAGGEWVPTGQAGELNAYEANDQTPTRLPWNVMLHPRSIPGEFMFAIGAVG